MTENDYKKWFERYGGWILIWIFCLIPVVALFYIRPIGSNYNSWYNIFANLGRILGIVGFVLYAINMLLALRKKWLENFFGGLNRVYIAHHITGGIALAFLIFHPLFLAIRYIEMGSFLSIQTAAKNLLPKGADMAGCSAYYYFFCPFTVQVLAVYA
jgi:predicted ferric reductase